MGLASSLMLTKQKAAHARQQKKVAMSPAASFKGGEKEEDSDPSDLASEWMTIEEEHDQQLAAEEKGLFTKGDFHFTTWQAGWRRPTSRLKLFRDAVERGGMVSMLQGWIGRVTPGLAREAAGEDPAGCQHPPFALRKGGKGGRRCRQASAPRAQEP